MTTGELEDSEQPSPDDPQVRVDVWELLTRSVAANPPKPVTTAQAEGDPKKEKKPRTFRGRLFWWGLDLVAALTWLYFLSKIFIGDVDEKIAEAVWPEGAFLLGYRVFFFLFLIVIVSAFFWKLRALLAAAYIALFPLVVLGWKIPNLIYRLRLYRSWVFWMLLFNGVVVFFRNFRYYLWSKGLAALAVLTALFANADFLLIPAGIIILLLLFVSAARVAIDTFRSSWFLKSQNKVIDFLAGRMTESVKWDAVVVQKAQSQDVLTSEEIQTLTQKVQFGIVMNIGVYAWAYRLQQYRELHLTTLFNAVAYAALFIRALGAFTLDNWILLKVEPSQFDTSGEGRPSILAVAVYSLSSMALSDGGGITAAGDWAYAMRLVAGVFSVLFLGVVVLNFLATVRGTKEDAELRRSVAELRRKAKIHREEFEAALVATFDEAFQKFVSLGLGGMVVIADFIRRGVPPDFFNDDWPSEDPETPT